ncbi:hypothetical protein HY493_04620 [Candidatus Woesearchaeota archaeon]|nr:hypothetical protein [Candidatus Woesearchaeota archaeon]
MAAQAVKLEDADYVRIPAPASTDPLVQEELKDHLESAFGVLTARESQVVRFYHGIDEEKIDTFADIARRLDISNERVRQLYRHAMGKLYANADLRLFLDDRRRESVERALAETEAERRYWRVRLYAPFRAR